MKLSPEQEQLIEVNPDTNEIDCCPSCFKWSPHGKGDKPLNPKLDLQRAGYKTTNAYCNRHLAEMRLTPEEMATVKNFRTAYRMVTLCFMCDPDRTITQKLKEVNIRVSHGLCTPHYEEMMEEIDKEDETNKMVKNENQD